MLSIKENYLNDQMNWIVQQRYLLEDFLHSDLLSKLDSNNSSSLSLDVCEGINSILEQFGDTDYGKVKYSKKCTVLDRVYV